MPRTPNNSLSPSIIRTNLQRAGLSLAVFRMLEYSIVDSVRSWFVVDEDYRRMVLSRDTDCFTASCHWLVQAGAIANTEVSELLEIRSRIDAMTINATNLIVDGRLDPSIFGRLRFYIGKLSGFWLQLAIDVDPDSGSIAQASSAAPCFVDYLIDAVEHGAEDLLGSAN